MLSRIGFETAYFQVPEDNRFSLTIPLVESFFQMDRVVVTATRTPKIFRTVPVATEVLSRNRENHGLSPWGSIHYGNHRAHRHLDRLLVQYPKAVRLNVTGNSLVADL
ncbi:MAG: hypothetical protein ACE5D1_01725 [Fidelibacterota bacterium]